MASLSFIVGIIGNIISILVFASPIGTFWIVVKKKSTENFKGIPYICTLLSTSLWTFYGLLKPDGLLIVTVNGVGAVLQFIYVTLFLIFAPKDTKVKSMKLVAILDIGFLGVVIAINLQAIHGSTRLTVVGFLCAGLTLGMYASPLSAIRTVIKMKSVEFMPFFLSFFLFLNGGVWSVYAALVKDYFIGVPNAIGFVLGLAQLVVYAVYKKKSKSIQSTERMEDEGSAQLVGGNLEMCCETDEDDGENKKIKKNRNLSKGRSLPKPSSVTQQHNLQKIVRTYSLSPHINWTWTWTWPELNDDVEKGKANNHLPNPV